MIALGAVEGWVVTHDGETLKSGFKSDFEAVDWLHKRHSYSVDHAVEHEGYDIVLVKDGKVTYSYKQAQRGKLGMGSVSRKVFDRNMVEIHPGQKVRVRWNYYYINTRTDEGVVRSVDHYGVTIDTDHPVPHVDAKGFHTGTEPWIYFPLGYNYEKQAYVADTKIGDPYEHGEIPIWIEVLEPGKSGSHGLGAVKAKASKHPMPIWPEFVDAYLEAALWTSQLDKDHTVDDFAQEAVDQAVRDANTFILSNQKDLDEASDDRAKHGHDFWLTRNRHGAGFWDRGYGVFGDMLTDSAHTYGEVDVYVGRDGKVRFQ